MEDRCFDWNIRIYYLLKSDPTLNKIILKYDKMNYFYETLLKWIYKYPNKSFCQIILDHFAPFYQQKLEGEFETQMTELLFRNCGDFPYLEESKRTYSRLSSIL